MRENVQDADVETPSDLSFHPLDSKSDSVLNNLFYNNNQRGGEPPAGADSSTSAKHQRDGLPPSGNLVKRTQQQE